MDVFETARCGLRGQQVWRCNAERLAGCTAVEDRSSVQHLVVRGRGCGRAGIGKAVEVGSDSVEMLRRRSGRLRGCGCIQQGWRRLNHQPVEDGLVVLVRLVLAVVVALGQRRREVEVGDGAVLGRQMAQEEVAEKGVFEAVQQRWAMIGDFGPVWERVG